MRFSIPTAALRGPLGHAFQAAKDPTAGVRCDAGAGLRLQGTNRQTWVAAAVAADVDVPGPCLLPPKVAEILREYGDVVVQVEATPSGVTLRLDGDEHALSAEGPDGFPGVPDAPDSSALSLAAGPLLSAIDRTLFAAAKEEGKYAMRGVLWDLAQAALVGTNRHQLAVCDLPGAAGGSALVPPKAAELVRRLLAECADDEAVEVVLRENDAFVTTPRGLVYTRLVEGRFPPYRDVIPKKATTTATLDWAAFIADVKRARLLTTDQAARVEFDFKGEWLTLRVPGTTLGKCEVCHPLAKPVTGPALTISLDPRYILSADRAFEGQVRLEMAGPERAAVFRSKGYLLLVVPLA